MITIVVTARSGCWWVVFTLRSRKPHHFGVTDRHRRHTSFTTTDVATAPFLSMTDMESHASFTWNDRHTSHASFTRNKAYFILSSKHVLEAFLKHFFILAVMRHFRRPTSCNRNICTPLQHFTYSVGQLYDHNIRINWVTVQFSESIVGQYYNTR